MEDKPIQKTFSTNNEEAKKVADKVAGKVIRLRVKDGREYIGIFGCADTVGAMFILDTCEIHETDTSKSQDFYHELYTPYQLNQPAAGSKSTKVFKYAGNMVFQRVDIERIWIDKKGQEFYKRMLEQSSNNEFVNEQAVRRVEADEAKEKVLQKLSDESKARIEKLYSE